MKNILWVLLLSTALAGCKLAGDIFQAGLVIGIITVLLIVAVIAWVVRKFRGPRGPRG